MAHLLVLFILFNSFAFGNYFFKNESREIIPDSVYAKIWEYGFCLSDEILIYNKKLDRHCSINLYSINDSTNIFTINIPDSILKYACHRYSVNGIVCINDTAIVAIADKILLYKIHKDCELLKILNLREIFSLDKNYFTVRLKYIDGEIIGIYDQYKFTKQDTNHFFIWSLSIRDSYKKSFLNFNNPVGYHWTIFQPRSILDISKELIAISDITDYKIRIYNRFGIVLDSISREIFKSENFNKITDRLKNLSENETIEILMENKDKSRIIHNIAFLNDNSILVCYTGTNSNSEEQYKIFYDLWQKKLDKWQLTISDFTYDSNSYNDPNVQNTPLYRNYIVINGIIISFDFNELDFKSYIIIRSLND